ncbi:MAG TPA: glycosyltransferase family 2 protein [Polyangia bacterium]|nr:glycosyltransferase family 2 protein [Polyangia bacterium]
MARLAAVVLNFRTASDTIACVRSLEASARPIDRLIVVDNGSGDGSEERLRAELPRAEVLQTGANLGFSGGCNLGVRRALDGGASLVVLVNSDILLPPDCLGALEAALDAHPRAGIAGPAIVGRDDPRRIETRGISFSGWSGRVWNHEFGRRNDAARGGVRVVDGVSGALMLIRREVLERVGELENEYFFSFEDLDFCLRARAAGFETICVDGAIAHHEGGRSIGARSARRIYFATRNHLLLARRAAPALPPPLGLVRQGWVAALNLAYVLTRSPTPVGEGLVAFGQGLWHHLRRRYGDGP